MRAIPPGLQAKLDSGCATLCRCWQIDRRDGQRLGFTDHDQPLRFGGVTYEASTGLTASAIEASTGLSIDNAQATGALSSLSLTEDDIEAGRYDGAELRVWLVDWEDVSLRVLQFRGSLGEITRGQTAFEVELRGLSEQLNRPVGRAFTPGCECNLGDMKCGVDTGQGALTVTGTVQQTDGSVRIEADGLSAFAPGWFDRGAFTWTSGPNVGAEGVVKRHDLRGGTAALELWLATPEPISPGDAFTVTAGCDKRFETCSAKFGNAVNFRGFPHMPGDDWVTTYPRRGDGNDGASRIG
jgi:uncharacterized phage protein (TIGR02218 family)